MTLSLCHSCAELFRLAYELEELGLHSDGKCEHCKKKRMILRYEVLKR